MSNDKEALLEKIRKLMALAKGNTTEDEAASAMAKVQELLARYDLSMSDVTVTLRTEKSAGVTREVFKDQRSRWKIILWQASAYLNRCEYLTFSNKKTFAHLVLGKPHQVMITKAMVEYLEAAVRRLCKQAEAEAEAKGLRFAEDGFRKSFRIGCASRIYARAVKLVEDRSKAAWDSATGERLPALLDLHAQARQEIQEYKESVGLKPKASKTKTTIRNSGAYVAGTKAGDSVSLDKQIENRKPMGLLS